MMAKQNSQVEDAVVKSETATNKKQPAPRAQAATKPQASKADATPVSETSTTTARKEVPVSQVTPQPTNPFDIMGSIRPLLEAGRTIGGQTKPVINFSSTQNYKSNPPDSLEALFLDVFTQLPKITNSVTARELQLITVDRVIQGQGFVMHDHGFGAAAGYLADGQKSILIRTDEGIIVYQYKSIEDMQGQVTVHFNTKVNRHLKHDKWIVEQINDLGTEPNATDVLTVAETVPVFIKLMVEATGYSMKNIEKKKNDDNRLTGIEFQTKQRWDLILARKKRDAAERKKAAEIEASTPDEELA